MKKKSNNSYFHIFECRCFILNNKKDNLKKFDAKSNESIFLKYSTSSKPYRIFNKYTLVIEESIHVIFVETNNLSSRKGDVLNKNTGSLEKGVKKLNLKDKPNQSEKGDSKDDDHEEIQDVGLNKQHGDLPKE